MWYSKFGQNVQKLYRDARRKAPYIIFIDEADELFSERGSGHPADTEGTNQFLTEVGGIKRTDGVLTITATNRDIVIDEAAKRYGRLGILFEIDKPSFEGRREIARIHLSRLGRQDLLDNLDYDEFARNTDGATGADIAGIISKTYWERFRAIEAKGKEPYKLTTGNFLKTAEDYHLTGSKMGFRQRRTNNSN